jgi:uncharacterized protein with GYD domain
LEVVAAMQFITLVQIRPGDESAETGSRVAAPAARWEHLKLQIQLVGGRVDQIWNVIGNDYDLMFLGQAGDPKTLHRIDALCEAEGYASKTHPAIEAAEYAKLVEDTADVLSYGGRQRQRQDVERGEAKRLATESGDGDPLLKYLGSIEGPADLSATVDKTVHGADRTR